MANDHENDDLKRSSKGIPHRIDLKMEEYKHALYQTGERHMVEIKSLRLSKEKKMARYTLNKKGLSDLFYKMHVADDRITCTPLKVDNEYL